MVLDELCDIGTVLSIVCYVASVVCLCSGYLVTKFIHTLMDVFCFKRFFYLFSKCKVI